MQQIIQTRVFFQKRGRLKYISHLDTMNVFMRAITRAGLPVWYTQGFNPRIYIAFPFPLSLGYEGLRESFEIRLVEEVPHNDLLERLNRVLPEELHVLEVAQPQMGPREVMLGEYRTAVRYETQEQAQRAQDKFREFSQLEKIIVEKKSKKGPQPVDLTDHIELLDFWQQEDGLYVHMILATGEIFNVNPRLYMEGFEDFSQMPQSSRHVTRIEFFDGDKKPFR